MTGLDNILAKIDEDGRKQADAILKEAETKAAQLRENAKQEAAAQAKEIIAKGQQAAADTQGGARSAAALLKRKAELTARQQLIRDTINAARQQLRETPADRYFSLLQNLAVAHALPQEGHILLSPADKARMPALFEEGLNAALSDPKARLTVAEETRAIDGGMVLAYGGIEENCSFEALFDAKADELQDLVQAILF